MFSGESGHLTGLEPMSADLLPQTGCQKCKMPFRAYFEVNEEPEVNTC